MPLKINQNPVEIKGSVAKNWLQKVVGKQSLSYGRI